eukprot:UN09995
MIITHSPSWCLTIGFVLTLVQTGCCHLPILLSGMEVPVLAVILRIGYWKDTVAFCVCG